MKQFLIIISIVSAVITSCTDQKPDTAPAETPFAEQGKAYVLDSTIEVAGRQGVACDGKYYYISSSTALYKYTLQGELVKSNEDPFTELELEANHLGDIDVYNGDIYTGIETFIDGVGKNIQVAVYDAETMEYKYSIPWNKESGQVEVCGLAVDREHNRVWMADWVQGHELYYYDLATKTYEGKVRLSPAPQLQQGIYCRNGQILISCDDGDAEKDESDHLYIADVYQNDQPVDTAEVKLWREMTDFKRVGEIEGLTFNPLTDNLIVLSNRGARIILGMPKGFYEGYDREIHEIYIYGK